MYPEGSPISKRTEVPPLYLAIVLYCYGYGVIDLVETGVSLRPRLDKIQKIHLIMHTHRAKKSVRLRPPVIAMPIAIIKVFLTLLAAASVNNVYRDEFTRRKALMAHNSSP